MKITIKQANVLANLNRIVFDKVGVRERRRPFLDGKDCYYQLICLSAKRLIAWDGHSLPRKIAEPDGVFGAGYGHQENAEPKAHHL